MVRCGIAAFLGDVERVLKADKGEEGEHRALHQQQPFALIETAAGGISKSRRCPNKRARQQPRG